ncbi:5-formyltetrahydrofolate cyclo-ligase [Alteromonas sp. H39]|uniref:5-formyltetrahydrofolate cyclo-ligase n=1 Tax=Alteromonas sp. H39 TaxID=3389876 RepID=UPI0039E1A7B7
MTYSRAQWRKTFREARNNLSAKAQQQAATAVAQRLSVLPEIRDASRVATYLDNDGEVSLAALISLLQARDIATSLPVLHPFSGKHLLFLDYTPLSSMKKNRFGIPEPELRCQDIRLLEEHQVILMPLVGFDSKGNRLGMGGGFYDRTLAKLNERMMAPLLVGVAHDCQQADALPVMHWDIPLNAIVTPTQTIRISQP